ncbi:MAG: hypothetical protein HY295_06160 [Thaumarchaeota archaeon]|nr:hypothetical protein [Nitrososphaerota archaeon]
MNIDIELTNIDSIVGNKNINTAAMVTTLSHLDSAILGISWPGNKWIDVPCGDGTTARVLKNPDEAFELYGKEWNTKFKVVIDLLNQAKGSADVEVGNKIVKLFDNLNYVEATLREMYKNSYLTFAATPCKEESQKEKRIMDRIITAASLLLAGLKVMIDSQGVKDLDALNNQILKIIDKITSMIIN